MYDFNCLLSIRLNGRCSLIINKKKKFEIYSTNTVNYFGARVSSDQLTPVRVYPETNRFRALGVPAW